jgi:hypothetical protein
VVPSVSNGPRNVGIVDSRYSIPLPGHHPSSPMMCSNQGSKSQSTFQFQFRASQDSSRHRLELKLPLSISLCLWSGSICESQQRPPSPLLAPGGLHFNGMSLSWGYLLAAIPTPNSNSGHFGMPTLFLEVREGCQRNVSGYLA